MLPRFEKKRDCRDGSYVVAGEGEHPMNTPNRKSNLIILDVSYLPEFMTDVVL